MRMDLIQVSKESLKNVRWVAGMNFMHHLTHLQIIYLQYFIHFKDVKLLVQWE